MANLMKLKTTFDGKKIRTNGKLNLNVFRQYMNEEEAERLAGKVNELLADFNKNVAALVNERIAKNS